MKRVELAGTERDKWNQWDGKKASCTCKVDVKQREGGERRKMEKGGGRGGRETDR